MGYMSLTAYQLPLLFCHTYNDEAHNMALCLNMIPVSPVMAESYVGSDDYVSYLSI